MLSTGLVPGNRNADNIDAGLADREHLFFPSSTYAAPEGIRAFSVTSFGFGQKGAQVVGVHPKYLFAALEKDQYQTYASKVVGRRRQADRALQEGIYGGRLVQLKDKSVYEDKDLESALLNRK
jgi:fatty acid synthase subunit alpha, fungi type